ncbi:MipA/OmpV family protein [Methylibium sp.]|uniref:MipA/OmpV family protein n=1 Tax=Methylibium sp. TaxID=2067992 RepID=UPI0018055DD5|nr:MipA/OmpV family protein [Methylibium sp.]MBA3588712.1 MipA/OmpV family protein [Methylibium sp.]
MTPRWIAPLLALTAALALPAAAAERPLWELGIGAAGLRLPHYRGSDQSHSWLVPLPYVVYRGRIFKADRDGARAVLYESDRFDFDLSLGAGVPTRSDDNDARRGMDDLAPTFELGPNLNWTLARDAGWKLDLRVPVRAAVTLESNARVIGWVSTPNLNLDLTRLHGWNLGLHAGPVFGSRDYHGYFYDVPSDEATAGRPAYRASGGFAGAQATAAMSRRLKRSWAALFVRYDSLDGARFAPSPLVRRENHFSFGIAYAWVLGTSSRTVTVEGE